MYQPMYRKDHYTTKHNKPEFRIIKTPKLHIILFYFKEKTIESSNVQYQY